jgi:hypothetical protein
LPQANGPSPVGPAGPVVIPGLRETNPPGMVANATRPYDVRLTIRVPHGGEQRVLEKSRPSIRALQDIALAYVRSQPGTFPMENQGATVPGGGVKFWGLRAVVRQAFFGAEAHDMSNYKGDDLTKLFSVLSAGSIPRFEVEVDYARPGQAPPPPPPHPASM